MTLQEVLNQIPQAAWRKRVPSVVKLVSEGVPVLTSSMDDETKAIIYSNGYVVYQNGSHATVFPLHDCKDYIYYTIEEKNAIPYEEFADQPWQVRVFMEGRDRLVHNQNNRKEGRTVSYDAYDSDALWEELSDRGSGDPLRRLVELDEKKEEMEALYRNLSKLTSRQKQVLIMCVVEGKTRVEVARELGTTHQAVTDSLKKSLRRLRKLYGIPE